MIWRIRAFALRLRGRLSRRHMRYQPPPLPPSAPEPPAPIDEHTATLRQRFATGAVPPGHVRPLAWHRYERIARAVRAEHQEETP
jgi:hypothetical protein